MSGPHRLAESGGLRSFFSPRSIAVAGVSPDAEKLASIIFSNLQGNLASGLLKSTLYAVNPRHGRIGNQFCYPDIRSLPEIPELLVVAVPALAAFAVLTDAARAGVKAAVMIPGGFSEVGNATLQNEIFNLARESGMRVLGPNTIGLLDTKTGVDTLFLKTSKSLPGGGQVVSHLKPAPGGVVIITQSGHLGESVSEELTGRGVGVRALVGIGNQADVSVEEVVEHFSNDRETKVIAVYIEAVAHGRRFMQVAVAASSKKPIIVLKVGKTRAGERAALTHTASIVGDYEAYQAAFKRCGIVEATGLQELIDYCVAFSRLPKALGDNLVIVTNAGGVGAIAADAASNTGLRVASPGPRSMAKLRRRFSQRGFMPNASLSNPLDLTATASTDEFVGMTELALALPEYDQALVLPTHQTPSISYDVGARLASLAKTGKPVAVCVIGWSELADKIRSDLAVHGIPEFSTPERAVSALAAATRWCLRTKALPLEEPRLTDRVGAIAKSRGLLPADVIEAILRSYGVPRPAAVILTHPGQLKDARRIGFPLACKLLSVDLAHKSDAGGVILGVSGEAGLASAFGRLRQIARRRRFRFGGVLAQRMVDGGVETILGLTRDKTFGPLVTFGAGGRHAELVRDYVTSIAPVGRAGAKEMIQSTRVGLILEGGERRPLVDIDMLSRVISKFSRILTENPSITEIEVNPMIVVGGSVLAIDVRAVASPTE